MKLLVLVIALGFTVPNTGAAPLEDDKECEPHSRPWQVSLTGGGASCSGALINEWWLVTSSYSCNPRPYDTIASLGEHDLSVQEGTEQHIRVAAVVHHSPYYRSPLHSLTMVRLSAPARLGPFVQPLQLPTRCPQPGETCTVSGWGRTSRNSFSSQLKCISVPVVDDQTCMSTFPGDLYWSPTMLCAGRYDTDNCLRDSGAVMECGGQLQGLSWLRRGCGDPADPSVYTKLCRYNSWIASVMDRYTPSTTTARPKTTWPVGRPQ